eukprot:TRINITY_DN8947_c0_g1_i2.p1 TRINITY_DN8947_c0_g1~~TRINITY_DN8947_c0_g1_i2.p1  ORF type:complete len:494 (+),score=63.51 TRINITY_DN8947_c0_g1_i2:103-1584(+)
MEETIEVEKGFANDNGKLKEWNWTKELVRTYVDSFSTFMSLLSAMAIINANLYFIGRLGRYEYTAAAGISNVLYNSLALGPPICMAFGLGNVGSQMIGAKKHKEFGQYFLSSVFFNIILSIIGYGLLVLATQFLAVSNLDEFTIRQAVNYVQLLFLPILTLSILAPTRQVLVSQQYFSFQTTINAPICLLHILWSWLFTFPLGLGFEGSPLAIGVTEALLILFTFIYILLYHSKSEVWQPWSLEVLRVLPEYLRKVVPFALTLYTEWVADEVLSIISSFIGEFELAAFTTYISVTSTIYMIPLALGITFGTKIGNAMGEGRAELARRHIKVGLISILLVNVVTTTSVFYFSRQLGGFFSDDQDVVQKFVDRSLFLSIFLISDSFSCAFSNILRTIGEESFALKSYISCYFSGIVLGCIIVFSLELITESIGLLLGLFLGEIAFILCSVIKMCRINLNNQAFLINKNLAHTAISSSFTFRSYEYIYQPRTPVRV